VEHNLLWNNGVNYDGIADRTGTAGNISAKPLFANGFHLQPNSPAVDAGMFVRGLKLDCDGNPRDVDGDGDGARRFDIGAFEFQALPLRR
jgi:hypothetical protein